MIADAMSHSVLPGLVAGYALAQGPHLLGGFVGAVVAALLTVGLVELLSRSKRLSDDAAIGLVFPAMFALGVVLVSVFFANIHIDTDAVLYGEIALTPFDTWSLGGQNLGPVAAWIFGATILLNGGFLMALAKELRMSTFDPDFSRAAGFSPALIHALLMVTVAVTTVGAFSAVGAILAVALIVVPAVVARLLTDRLRNVVLVSLAVGIGASWLGTVIAFRYDVSISGMIATCLGVAFVISLVFAPRGMVMGAWRRGRVRQYVAAKTLTIHLVAHEETAESESESRIDHLATEFGWAAGWAHRIVQFGLREGWWEIQNQTLRLTPAGRAAALEWDHP